MKHTMMACAWIGTDEAWSSSVIIRRFALEGIRRKPVSAQIEGTIHFVGFALLMLLFVVITYFDITRIFG